MAGIAGRQQHHINTFPAGIAGRQQHHKQPRHDGRGNTEHMVTGGFRRNAHQRGTLV